MTNLATPFSGASVIGSPISVVNSNTLKIEIGKWLLSGIFDFNAKTSIPLSAISALLTAGEDNHNYMDSLGRIFVDMVLDNHQATSYQFDLTGLQNTLSGLVELAVAPHNAIVHSITANSFDGIRPVARSLHDSNNTTSTGSTLGDLFSVYHWTYEPYSSIYHIELHRTGFFFVTLIVRATGGSMIDRSVIPFEITANSGTVTNQYWIPTNSAVDQYGICMNFYWESVMDDGYVYVRVPYCIAAGTAHRFEVMIAPNLT